jgi:AbrB family looped-hinge helix DNA binding protein
MSRAITIDRAGRIVLPIDVRRQLNIGPGSSLRLDVVAQRIELSPEAEPEAELGLSATGRQVLSESGRAFDAAAATRAERESQSKRNRRK